MLVHSLVVLLRPEADSPSLTGEVVRQFSGALPYRVFRYQVVRVWELSSATLLKGSLGLLPLAPLANDARTCLPEVLQALANRIRHELPPEQCKLVWSATEVLLGLRYSQERIGQMIEFIHGIEESSTYQAILQKGRALGKDEGSLEGQRETIFRQGRKKFGPPESKIAATLGQIHDKARLDSLAERLLDVESWQELLNSEADASREN